MKRETGHAGVGSRCRVGVDDAHRSTRRVFIIAAASWPALTWAEVVFAQAKQAPILLGWPNTDSRALSGQYLTVFKEALAALGWKERSQIVIEERWADGQINRLQSLGAELAARKPAIIVAAASAAVAAAAKTAPNIPIVMATSGDPVSSGFAASLARPGGMITGVSSIAVDVSEKYVEFLVAATPKLKRVGVLIDANAVIRAQAMEAVRRSVAQHSVEARFAEVANPEEIAAAISRLAKDGVQGLIVTAGLMLRDDRRRIVRLALARRWPVAAGRREFAEEGALFTYGVDPLANFRRAAYYVDRILKGTKPGDLPIEQPTRFELVLNMKTAKALGIKIPQSILLRADKVID